ncbi:MAG TPA: TA system VapC family ribonuclease toxin [Acidobacteriaceae bacterium]|nr:TA system VapC family ribonuclease toxin [Acidobacteriaceae bacterium]
MTLFFPDVNVWVALSVADHSHSEDVWRWLRQLPADARLALSRFTQMGLLRLLTQPAVMGSHPLTLRRAWQVCDRWLADPRVQFYPEPRSADSLYRQILHPFAAQPGSKWVGDGWLLAFAAGASATLVTFDRALHDHARRCGHASAMPV